MKQWEQRLQVVRGFLVLLVVLVCAFLWCSLLSFDPADPPSPHVWPHPDPTHNLAGRAGAWVAYQMFVYFGKGAYAAVIGLTIALSVLLRQGRLPSMWQRVLGISLLIVVTSCVAHLMSSASPNAWPELRGGVLGYVVAGWLVRTMKVFAYPALGYCFLVGILFTAEGVLMQIPEAIRKRRERLRVVSRSGGSAGEELSGLWAIFRRIGQAFPWARMPQLAGAGTGGHVKIRPGSRPAAGTPEHATATAVADEEEEIDDEEELEEDEYEEEEEEDEYEEGDEEEAEGEYEDDDDADDEPVAPEPKMVVKFASPPRVPDAPAAPVPKPYPAELEAWELPSVSLLHEPEYTFSAKQEAFVREKARILENTLQDYRIEGKVVEIDTGPVITMYELQVAPGIKVSQISTLANDIARALRAPSVRVVAPIPGKTTIGIEVPNLDKEKVRLKELMILTGDAAHKMMLPLFLGKNASGEPLLGDLTKMPHMLIAGTTGSGKSVCINSIIASMLMTQRPDMVKLILVDPKMVEMSVFREVPHLMCPIVTETERAEKILEWATVKMDERYALLAEASVRNIAAYNRLSREEKYERFNPSSEEEKSSIPLHLPYIVIIIDELADMMLLSAKEVELHLSRLAQKSRAVGVHIIVATQRPEAKIVTGLIKSNLPCRIAFRVASRMDSRIVLDQNGAEVLMGQGDMLYLPPGSSKLMRAQGTFLEDQEVKDIVRFLNDKADPEFHPELMQLGKQQITTDGPRDERFEEAVEVVLQTRRGSVSLLQRRLTVGYSRASRLIDEMAAMGIVGAYKGSQAREVLMTADEWQALKEQEAVQLRDANNADPVPDMVFDDDL